jgi:hypothetical protein
VVAVQELMVEQEGLELPGLALVEQATLQVLQEPQTQAEVEAVVQVELQVEQQVVVMEDLALLFLDTQTLIP